jgi:hypothetical protein
MKKEDLVQLKEDSWDVPGIVIRGPYGAVFPIKTTWEGKALISEETLVVDVLVGAQVYSKIPVENLIKIK